ncbi:Zinc finger protein [Penaeus vannamei]|uniref:Zinc finger protein n=1 Tax=Penaeus vannamei TaxID=6689 RepID=A0A423U7L1_PENVA|nr:Zinc finger protein [Penaeus vannamei]
MNNRTHKPRRRRWRPMEMREGEEEEARHGEARGSPGEARGDCQNLGCDAAFVCFRGWLGAVPWCGAPPRRRRCSKALARRASTPAGAGPGGRPGGGLGRRARAGRGRGPLRGGDLAPCPECGREFHGLNKKFLLTRHMITHTGEKPYQCPYCPYRANVSSNLTRHLRTVHTPSSAAGALPGALPVPAVLSTAGGTTASPAALGHSPRAPHPPSPL